MNIEANEEDQILSSIKKRNFWKEEEAIIATSN